MARRHRRHGRIGKQLRQTVGRRTLGSRRGTKTVRRRGLCLGRLGASAYRCHCVPVATLWHPYGRSHREGHPHAAARRVDRRFDSAGDSRSGVRLSSRHGPPWRRHRAVAGGRLPLAMARRHEGVVLLDAHSGRAGLGFARTRPESGKERAGAEGTTHLDAAPLRPQLSPLSARLSSVHARQFERPVFADAGRRAWRGDMAVADPLVYVWRRKEWRKHVCGPGGRSRRPAAHDPFRLGVLRRHLPGFWIGHCGLARLDTFRRLCDLLRDNRAGRKDAGGQSRRAGAPRAGLRLVQLRHRHRHAAGQRIVRRAV